MSALYLITNIVSWVLVTLIMPLVHYYRLSKEPFTNTLAVLYSLLALSLLVNSVSRIIYEDYAIVVLGGTLTKIFLLGVVIITLIKHLRNREL